MNYVANEIIIWWKIRLLWLAAVSHQNSQTKPQETGLRADPRRMTICATTWSVFWDFPYQPQETKYPLLYIDSSRLQRFSLTIFKNTSANNNVYRSAVTTTLIVFYPVSRFNPMLVLFIGEPISCISDGAIPGHVLNTFCWITYTFTLPRAEHKGLVHPGLGNEYDEEKRIHAYYQWVPFMLFFQVRFLLSMPKHDYGVRDLWQSRAANSDQSVGTKRKGDSF